MADSSVATERSRADSVVASVRNFTARSADRTIVGPLSFTLDRGRVLALVGESGSGKTTTGLALLQEHFAGVVTEGSISLSDDRIGYVPQHPGAVLTPGRRAGSVLAEIARAWLRHGPAGVRRPSRPAVRDCILAATTRARLEPDLLRRFPHQLSGGQQQRLVLAMALICDPVILIADEPTTGLDPELREMITEELAGLVHQGMALLLLSHDLDIVRRLADDTIVLRHGEVAERGSEVWTSPRHPYSQQLAGDQDARPTRSSARTSKNASLKITNLTAGFRRTGVLDRVSFAIQHGECLAVTGPSGAGKTTLGRCLAGLHPVRGGQLHLDGELVPWTVRRRRRAELARCQYVFQDARASFEPYHTVAHQVARTGVRLRDLDVLTAHAEATALLDRVGLPDQVHDRRIDSLSGGEAQRAALARALMAQPTVLICDEMTTGLDVVTRGEILTLLAELCSEGLSLIMITHEPAVLRRLADRELRL